MRCSRKTWGGDLWSETYVIRMSQTWEDKRKGVPDRGTSKSKKPRLDRVCHLPETKGRTLWLKHLWQWREVGRSRSRPRGALWTVVKCLDLILKGDGKPMECFKQGSKKGFINSFKQDILHFTMKIETSRKDFALAPVSLATHYVHLCLHTCLPDCNLINTCMFSTLETLHVCTGSSSLLLTVCPALSFSPALVNQS